MNLTTKISALLGTTVVTLIAALFGMTSTAAADCVYQYNANGFTTSTTPVFNQICGAPQVGDEANFVRIRPDNGNDATDTDTYSIGTINSDCSTGDKYDIWNYVHNNASQNDNPDVGNGSAVAEGTYINMVAPIGTTSDNFSFTATVGDTGNLTGTAGPTSTTNMTPAVLDCNGNQVQLSIVPGSIIEYSLPYGSDWQTLPNQSTTAQAGSYLNTNLPIGSTNAGLSSLGSGTQWGCWNYRILIVYQVEVTAVPPSQTPPTCNTITANDQADVKDVSYTANSANVTGYNLDLYSGTTTSGTPLASSGNIGVNALPYQFSSSNLTAGQKYTIVATVLSNLGNVTSNGCTYTFTTASTPPTPPPATTTSTPPTTTTTLVNTGPGTAGIVGIFAGATALGTGAYHWLLKRRLARR